MTGSELWKEYAKKSGLEDCPHSEWAFGGDSDTLSSLVLEGKKTATASAYPLYGKENEKLPEKGDYSVILDGKGNGVCIIRTDKVSVVPFSDVGEDHAYKEGEGDRTLEYWHLVHKEFFTECMEKRSGSKINDSCTTGKVYDVYKAWCGDNTNGYAKSAREFRKNLAEYLGKNVDDLITHTSRGNFYRDYTLSNNTKLQYSRAYGYDDTALLA